MLKLLIHFNYIDYLEGIVEYATLKYHIADSAVIYINLSFLFLFTIHGSIYKYCKIISVCFVLKKFFVVLFFMLNIIRNETFLDI